MKTKKLSTPFLNACNAGQFAHIRQFYEIPNWRKLTQEEYDIIAAAVLGNYLDIPIDFVVASIQCDRMLLKK